MESNLNVEFNTPHTLFQARWATGFFSDRRWFSANRCMHVMLTPDALITRLMFPYCHLSSTHWGFKNTIPLDHIKSVHKSRFLGWWPTVKITFIDATNHTRCLEICFTGPLPQFGSRQQRVLDSFVQILSISLEEKQALAPQPILVDTTPQ